MIVALTVLWFHYLSLVRFATHMQAKSKRNSQVIADLEREAREWKTLRTSLEQEVASLSKRTAELEKCEKELRPWKEREDKIKHYLGVFTEVTRFAEA